MTDDLNAILLRGIEQARRGETIDRGDFSQYLPTHEPRRGDAVEQWLKAQRDRFSRNHDVQWDTIDGILDEYRLHADTCTPLDQHVCEGNNNADDCHGCYEKAKQ